MYNQIPSHLRDFFEYIAASNIKTIQLVREATILSLLSFLNNYDMAKAIFLAS